MHLSPAELPSGHAEETLRALDDAPPTPLERLRTESRHLRAARLAAVFASQHAHRAWAAYVEEVETGGGNGTARRRLEATLAQHAYAWAVAKGADLDSDADRESTVVVLGQPEPGTSPSGTSHRRS